MDYWNKCIVLIQTIIRLLEPLSFKKYVSKAKTQEEEVSRQYKEESGGINNFHLISCINTVKSVLAQYL